MADRGNVANTANTVVNCPHQPHMNNPAGEENPQQANLWREVFDITFGPIFFLTAYFIQCMFGQPQTLSETQIQTMGQQLARIYKLNLLMFIFLTTVILLQAPRPLNYRELFFQIASHGLMFLTICFISPKFYEDPQPPNYDYYDDFDDLDI